MKAIFKFTPRDKHNLLEKLFELLHKKDFLTMINANIGTELSAEISVAAKVPEKEQMYAYYHRVILDVAMKMYTEDGWESVDKVKADYLLKAECGKEVMYNAKTDTESIYLLDKKAMTKEQLRKYIVDCVLYLEKERGYKVPESANYLAEMRTGHKGFETLG